MPPMAVPAIIRERSINRRHVYTERQVDQSPACIQTDDNNSLRTEVGLPAGEAVDQLFYYKVNIQ